MKKTRKKVKLHGIDRLLITILVLLVVSSPIVVVYSKSVLSESNIELERMKKKIDKQESINESINMKINELASLSNIQDVAKEFGLKYQNENIVVIVSLYDRILISFTWLIILFFNSSFISERSMMSMYFGFALFSHVK